MSHFTGQVLTQAEIDSWFTSGTYTPTLVGMVIGTGGTPTNSAKYTFCGFPAGGVLTVEGMLKFGTSGQTFPAATSTLTLPSGYSFIDTSGAHHPMGVTFNDVSPGVLYKGYTAPNSATVFRLWVGTVTASQLTVAATSTTVPFAWASNDEIYYKFSARCTGP